MYRVTAPGGMNISLQAMERAAEASGGSGAPQLQFHNLVNNADVVPRLLGTSLESLHGLLEAYIPMIQVWVFAFPLMLGRNETLHQHDAPLKV